MLIILEHNTELYRFCVLPVSCIISLEIYRTGCNLNPYSENTRFFYFVKIACQCHTPFDAGPGEHLSFIHIDPVRQS